MDAQVLTIIELWTIYLYGNTIKKKSKCQQQVIENALVSQ